MHHRGRRNGRTSAIHHALGVTNVIPDFCLLAYDWGFGRNELDGLEGKIMKFTSRCYEFVTKSEHADNPQLPEQDAESASLAHGKARDRATGKHSKLFGIRNKIRCTQIFAQLRTQLVPRLI